MNRKHILLLVLIISMFSCKESDRDEDKSTYTSADVAFATNVVYDIFKTTYQAAYYSQGIVTSADIDSNSVFGCDTITTDTLSSPKWLQIKFNTDCTTNSIVRNGKLYATFNGHFNTAGTTANMAIYDFTYNGYTVYDGSMSCKYEGLTDSFPTYSITFNELKIINSFSQKIVYSGSHKLQIIQGQTTQSITDDVYSISGSNSGRVFKGNGFSSQIITNLGLAGNCNWIGSGVVTVKPENNPTRTLDFGSGCDSKINVKVYDINHELELP